MKKEKKKSTFFKDFKAFISKGNVLDLAVATIIGAAFGNIVTSFTNGIIMPLVSLLFKAENLDKLVVELRPAVMNGEEVVEAAVTWQYGTLIQAVINFLIIALFLFILVRAIANVRKSLDIDARMKESIQAKLDADEELSDLEKKWVASKQRRHPEDIPKKSAPAPAPVPPEPSSTDKLLMEILGELKKK